MRTLFVENKHHELRYERASILVYENGQRKTSVPLSQLERIIVSPSIALTAGVLGVVVEHEVALMVVNATNPNRSAYLSGAIKTDIQRRVCQFALLADYEFRTDCSQQIVLFKTLNQIRFCSKMLVRRPDLRCEMIKSATQLKEVYKHLTENKNIDSLAELRGIEGSAARVYFKGYQLLFPESLNFNRRTRRPPLDPVNSCLSLAYTLFHNEAVLAIKEVGLDPAIGFYHSVSYNRESLACDFLEPVRPQIDEWVWQLFQSRTIRSDDFTYQGQSCLLSKTGKKKFYSHYRAKVKSFRRLLRKYARIYLNLILTHETKS
jgi:CRISP-associated protein Cas1